MASVRSFLLFLSFFSCFQHEQLGVGGQHFADGVLKLTSGLHAAPHLLDPFLGDVLDLFFSLDHKGQRPDRMAAVLRTMTGRLAAAEMSEGEGARESILGDMETAHQLKLALAEPRSERALGS